MNNAPYLLVNHLHIVFNSQHYIWQFVDHVRYYQNVSYYFLDLCCFLLFPCAEKKRTFRGVETQWQWDSFDERRGCKAGCPGCPHLETQTKEGCPNYWNTSSNIGIAKHVLKKYSVLLTPPAILKLFRLQE